MSDPVTIVGAGIAGLSLGFELTRRNRCVHIFDSGSTGGGASKVATSYLEPRFGQSAARRLEWESLRRWPEIADAVGVALHRGQWRYAWADDEPAIRRDMQRRSAGGWSTSWIDGDTLRDEYAELSPRIVGAVRVEEPALVDARAVCAALAARIRQASQDNAIHEYTRLQPDTIQGTTVLANGIGAAEWSDPALPSLRRLKGTTLRYRTDAIPPTVLRHGDATLVPRPDGVVVGSTKERDAVDLAPDPQVVAMLNERAVRVIPALAEITPEPVCGWRSYAQNTALALGRSGNLWWSLGHGGVGYLRAPIVAQELAAAICGEPEPFVHCGRFFEDATSGPIGLGDARV